MSTELELPGSWSAVDGRAEAPYLRHLLRSDLLCARGAWRNAKAKGGDGFILYLRVWLRNTQAEARDNEVEDLHRSSSSVKVEAVAGRQPHAARQVMPQATAVRTV